MLGKVVQVHDPSTHLGRLRQEDHKGQASLGYIVRICLKQTDKGLKQARWW